MRGVLTCSGSDGNMTTGNSRTYYRTTDVRYLWRLTAATRLWDMLSACCKNPGGSHILEPVTTLYIDDLCVDKDCRGQHIGTELYRHVLDFAREKGCHNLTLNVWSCNPEAMRFYERCGLTPQKVCMEQII